MDETLTTDTEKQNQWRLIEDAEAEFSSKLPKKSQMMEVAGNLLKELKDKQSLGKFNTSNSLDLPFLSRNFFYPVEIGGYTTPSRLPGAHKHLRLHTQ